jgi:hypothetical protein
MDTQADSARALRRSLETPAVGSQEAHQSPSLPDVTYRTPPASFTRLVLHLGHCPDCPERPCTTGSTLARVWLAVEETRERVSWPE